MDEPNPYLIRLGMGFFLLFVLSGFKSCSEVKYSLRAKDTTARVTKIYEEKDRHDNHVGWTVAYDFHNDDTHESQKGYSH